MASLCGKEGMRAMPCHLFQELTIHFIMEMAEISQAMILEIL
jgi:hypothetical protein